MIAINRRTRIFLSKEPTDMRASYDSLCLRVKSVLSKDPFSGHLFVFINKRRTACKCLFYDGTGLVLICKRMESGTFSQVNRLVGEVILTQAEFNLFFEGASIDKRFIDSPREIKKGHAKLNDPIPQMNL